MGKNTFCYTYLNLSQVFSREPLYVEQTKQYFLLMLYC